MASEKLISELSKEDSKQDGFPSDWYLFENKMRNMVT